MDKSQNVKGEGRHKNFRLYDSIYIIFSKRQNYRDEKTGQWLLRALAREKGTREFLI